MLTPPFETREIRAPQLGLIVLQADETIERDMRLLLPAQAGLMVSRVPSGTHVTPHTLSAMSAELENAARLFPRSAQFSVVGYGCTSGTAEIGSARVAKAVNAGARTGHVTEPVSALIAACHHLDVARLGILSPYVQSVSERLHEVLSKAGFEISAFASFNESEEEKVARIAPDSIRDAAVVLAGSAQMDALFISCTNLRALDLIPTLEKETGVPVMTSNQVLAWDMLRLAEIDRGETAAGALWERS